MVPQSSEKVKRGKPTLLSLWENCERDNKGSRNLVWVSEAGQPRAQKGPKVFDLLGDEL